MYSSLKNTSKAKIHIWAYILCTTGLVITNLSNPQKHIICAKKLVSATNPLNPWSYVQ